MTKQDKSYLKGSYKIEQNCHLNRVNQTVKTIFATTVTGTQWFGKLICLRWLSGEKKPINFAVWSQHSAWGKQNTRTNQGFNRVTKSERNIAGLVNISNIPHWSEVVHRCSKDQMGPKSATHSLSTKPQHLCRKRRERAQEKIKIKKTKAKAHLNTTLPIKVPGHNQLSKSLAEH